MPDNIENNTHNMENALQSASWYTVTKHIIGVDSTCQTPGQRRWEIFDGGIKEGAQGATISSIF